MLTQAKVKISHIALIRRNQIGKSRMRRNTLFVVPKKLDKTAYFDCGVIHGQATGDPIAQSQPKVLNLF
jgi:hypothetical protein